MTDTINGRTPEDIKKGLEVCSTGDGCIQCPYDEPNLCHGIENKADALAYIQQLEERNSKLEYTLLGVMHSVDKWLDVESYDFDKDDGTVAATRASNAREIALKAIEKAQADLAQVERERDAAVHDIRNAKWFLCHVCQNYYRPDPAVRHYECKVLGKFSDIFSPSDFAEEDDNPISMCGKFKWRGVCEENTKEDSTC